LPLALHDFFCVRGTISLPSLLSIHCSQSFDCGGKRSAAPPCSCGEAKIGQTRVGEGLEALPHSQTQRATRSRNRLSRFYKNPDGHNEINKNGHSFLLFIFWCFFFLSPLIVFMLLLVICFLFLPCAVLCVSPFCVQTHTIINHTHTQSDTHTRTHRAASPLSVAIKES